MTIPSADLELALHRRDYYRSSVELRFRPPGDEAESFCSGDATFDIEELQNNSLNDVAYGRMLADSVFAGEKVRRKFDVAFQSTAGQGQPLRIRLLIGPTVPELQTLRWERLCLPDSDSALLHHEWIHFSRFLTSHEWRPFRRQAKSKLRVLALVANPTNLWEKYRLDPIDTGFEKDLVERSALNCDLTVLSESGTATYENLATELTGKVDVLYIVCHGHLDTETGRPFLFLEDPKGLTERVDGIKLAKKIEGLSYRPRLVVMASCDSASHVADVKDVNATSLAAMGPILAEIGIPAILAFHGKIDSRAAQEFMPIFFQHLMDEGQIDGAVAAGRWKISDHPDWWKPVLFSRLLTGELWYTSGLASGHGKAEGGPWKDLINNIKKHRCTPIIGPGATEYLLGSRRELTRSWADDESFPLAISDKSNLAMVCQYLQTRHSDIYMRDKLEDYLRDQLKTRYRDEIPPGVDDVADLVETVGRNRIQTDPTEPHRILASLGLPIYINANYGDLLSAAFAVQSGEPKKPVVELFRWKELEEIEWPLSRFDLDPDWRPSSDEPLVLHMFGNLRNLETVVLSEDDYFDYLIGIDAQKKHFPGPVNKALSTTALLFLGFRIDDWGFRVLYRSIVNREGRAARRKYRHVAVQVDPEDAGVLDPREARDFLVKYFDEDKISIYWGSVDDFVRDLKEKFNE